MLKIKLIFVFVCLCIVGIYQKSYKIYGKFIDKVSPGDSVLLIPEFNTHYYEKKMWSAEVKDNHFLITGNLSYPQMFRVRLKSETDKIPCRSGFFFIENGATSMSIGSTDYENHVNGPTGTEFKQIFIPFFYSKLGIKNSLEQATLYDGKNFDLRLLDYVKKYPNSYVALWFLIARFNYDGYSELHNNILNAFSAKVKEEKLWNVTNNEFQQIRIKEDKTFPALVLKDTALNTATLKIPKGKYTLIDFWFSRCRPCLDQLPELKKLYTVYGRNEFNIVGISTDMTKNVKPYWQKRVAEYQIPWDNYLDENAKEALVEKISSYPTNFLLDEKGRVIYKNISLDDLKVLLAIHLSNKPPNYYDGKRF